MNNIFKKIFQKIIHEFRIHHEHYKQAIVHEYAEENPRKFIEIAENTIGAVELAEHLHDKHNLFELVDGLEAELIADLESEQDYYNQINYNYRYL